MASVKKHQDKNGRITSFQIRVYKGRDANGKQLPPYTKSVEVPEGTTKRQLEKMIEVEKVKFELECQGGASANSHVKFRDFAEEIIELKASRGKSSSTISHYRDMLELRLYPKFGHMKVKDITPGMINQFYTELMQPGQNKKDPTKGLSEKTVLEHHRLLSTIFEEAVKYRIIDTNPAKAATPPSVHRPDANYFEENELLKIKKAFDCEEIKWRTLGYLFMIYGNRRGEYAGIKRSAIDFEKHTITISSCVCYDRRNGVYDKPYPKCNKPRTLPMSPEIENMLKEYLNWLDTEREKYGDLWVDSPYIFTGQNGGMINTDTISNHFNRMAKKWQKIDPDFPSINTHAFRHTVPTLLINDKEDIASISDYIGDKPETVLKHYLHTVSSGKKSAHMRMNDIIFGKNESD